MQNLIKFSDLTYQDIKKINADSLKQDDLGVSIASLVDGKHSQSEYDLTYLKANLSKIAICETIADRNALSKYSGMQVLVINATQDESVKNGSALYVLKDDLTTWIKLAEYESLDIEIIDNLTTADSTKPLSANQGVILNDLISSEAVARQEADNALQDEIDLKADNANVYSKLEIDNALDLKQDNIYNFVVENTTDLANIQTPVNNDIAFVKTEAKTYKYNLATTSWIELSTISLPEGSDIVVGIGSEGTLVNTSITIGELQQLAGIEQNIQTTLNDLQTDLNLKADNSNVYSKLEIDNALLAKVNTETGKGLSTNDFTNDYKSQVDANTTARHTHTNKAVLDAITASYTTEEQTKLAGIQTGATANDTDANLKNRSNHTGTQAISTIDGLQSALDLKANLSDGKRNSTKFVEFVNGLDTNNGDTETRPYKTISKAWADITSSGQINVLGSSTYNETHTFSASQTSIKTTFDEGAKLTGSITLVPGVPGNILFPGNTSIQFRGGMFGATLNDGSNGTTYFEHINVGGATFNFSNGGYKVIRSSSSAPTQISLTGTGGVLYLENISGGEVPISVGSGWLVYQINAQLKILSNSGTIVSGVIVNQILTSQTELNAITAITNNADGFYILNFANPVIAGLTLSSGDIIFKTGSNHSRAFTISSAPSSVDVVSGGGTERVSVVKQGAIWVRSDALGTTKTGVYTNVKDILVAGTNTSLSNDDTNQTITINSTGSGGGGGTSTPPIVSRYATVGAGSHTFNTNCVCAEVLLYSGGGGGGFAQCTIAGGAAAATNGGAGLTLQLIIIRQNSTGLSNPINGFDFNIGAGGTGATSGVAATAGGDTTLTFNTTNTGQTDVTLMALNGTTSKWEATRYSLSTARTYNARGGSAGINMTTSAVGTVSLAPQDINAPTATAGSFYLQSFNINSGFCFVSGLVGVNAGGSAPFGSVGIRPRVVNGSNSVVGGTTPTIGFATGGAGGICNGVNTSVGANGRSGLVVVREYFSVMTFNLL